MTLAHWHTPNALDWLKNILHDRFGYNFNLDVQNDGCAIAISLHGHERCITLAVDAASFVRVDSDLPCSKWDGAGCHGWFTALPDPLPAPGAAQLPIPLISENVNGFHCGYDILGLVYWMLTRQEEVGRTDLDVHGRFPATSSHAFKYGYLDRPIVDEWLHVLGQIVNCTWPRIKLKQHAFNIKVSHDVDQPSLYSFKSWSQIARIMGGHAIKRRDIRAFIQAPYIKLTSHREIHSSDPLNTFEWIMDQSEYNGLSSAFYFICGHSDPRDADYQAEDPRIRSLMRRIHARGHEIGLHPSYGSYKKPEMMRYEADRLRTICDSEHITQKEWGGRMHYLRWSNPETLRAWGRTGLDYDSTLGYADCPGFRCGTCYEYPAFDSVAGEILKYRIRPLVMMEATLLDSTYLGIGANNESLKIIQRLKEACRKVNGMFTLLWHNSSLITSSERRLFQSAVAK